MAEIGFGNADYDHSAVAVGIVSVTARALILICLIGRPWTVEHIHHHHLFSSLHTTRENKRGVKQYI